MEERKKPKLEIIKLKKVKFAAKEESDDEYEWEKRIFVEPKLIATV